MKLPAKYKGTKAYHCELDEKAYRIARNMLKRVGGDPELALYAICDLWMAERNAKQREDERDKSIEF